MSSQQAQLTFGVEIEAIMQVDLSQLTDEEADSVDDIYAYGQVKDRLESAGISTNKVIDDIYKLNQEDGRYNRWTVEPDVSIQPLRLAVEGYSYVCGIELVSRKLPFTDESYSEVGRALHAARTYAALVLNRTCALQFHIGRSDDSLIPFRTTRNLIMLGLAFEDLIDSMGDPSFLHSDEYDLFAPQLSTFHKFDQYGELSRFQNCQKVKNTNTIKELIGLLDPEIEDDERYVAYNILGTNPDAQGQLVAGKKVKPTIEFRRITASVDPVYITNYLKYIRGLVRYCETSSPNAVWQAVKNCRLDVHGTSPITRRSFTLQSFLELIGLELAVVRYFVRQEWRPKFAANLEN